MVNYAKLLVQKLPYLRKAIPTYIGKSGKATVGKTKINLWAMTVGGKEGEALKVVLAQMKNPKIEMAYKVKSNYAIGDVKIKDGKKLVAHGSVSAAAPGSPAGISEIKTRISAGENGELLRQSGFFDATKPASLDNMAISLSRRNGKMKADFSSGKAAATRIEVNEKDVLKKAEELGYKRQAQLYTEGIIRGLQRKLNKFMENIDKATK